MFQNGNNFGHILTRMPASMVKEGRLFEHLLLAQSQASPLGIAPEGCCCRQNPAVAGFDLHTMVAGPTSLLGR